MAWTIGGILAVVALAAIALQIAIARDGPAVLSAVDRVSGGDGGAELKAKITTGDHPDQKLLIWGPKERPTLDHARPVLLFVHGGSWNSGDPESYDFVGRAFVERGFIVALAGYRLGEAGQYPGMVEDVAGAFAQVREQISAYGGDPEHIVLAGHSAGAYNMMMVALEEKWLRAHSLAPDAISGIVGISGPYDFLPLDSDSTKAAFGHVEEEQALKATQPINNVNGDAPPMLLIHGEEDTTVGLFHSKRLSRKIQAAGGTATLSTYPAMSHTDPLISIASPWRNRRDIVDQIATFARYVKAQK
ncbi:alpha/beta hydrolase [Erythrobacter sp. SCSIO 43205]|uniref:alpha/beta hydrolase n=1 Tax=Erythrobacter sp. SCSIO 43205 TaxID=2779361 RepID=UPI001CA83F70|nr:alpha/beta hydrolase [Erythrobacter sp. SCSIO 43205]UAB78413.1 alpha/beta hydrolase [Erythrobacter sp. SCSIO 43205]